MPPARPIDDRLLRTVGILGFGLSIPHLTHLFGPYNPRSPVWWLGHLWFVLLAALIWNTNRWLLFQQQRHADWFAHPLRKIMLLLTGVAFGTVPVTLAMLLAWYAAAGFAAPDRAAIQTVTLVNVICVVFVTHVYETVFLIKAREEDLLEVERLSRSRAEAELEAWKAQVDPHFLFNSLNTLAYLIEHDRERAAAFNDALARVYRYILASRGRHLVLLREELGFLDDYLALLTLRFGDAIHVTRDDGIAPDRRLVPPIALQTLVENAVKHNEFSRAHPLELRLDVAADAVTVSHPRRPRRDPVASAGVGLLNLAERCRLTTGRAIEVNDQPATFAVTLPLLAA